jgi:hypothetical protein
VRAGGGSEGSLALATAIVANSAIAAEILDRNLPRLRIERD